MGQHQRPVEIWGVLNVTPDSFSDGGLYDSVPRALGQAEKMLQEGAHVIDVGGESSRPAGRTYGRGAEPVSASEEIRRVVPVVREVVHRLGARVSVDTVKAEVAAAAIEAGASIVNDVSCGRSPELLAVAAAGGCRAVLMHNRGRGQVTAEQAHYTDIVAEVIAELGQAVARAKEAGIAAEQIWLDPGLGFAKTSRQTVMLLACSRALVDTGYPVLVGPSRKSFIAELVPKPGGEVPAPADRAGGTAAAIALAVQAGVRAVRVHDVAAMRQAAYLAAAVREATI